MTNQLYPPPPVPPHPPLTTHSLHAIPLTAVSLFFCSDLQTRLQPVTRRLLRPGRLHVRIPLTARWRSSWWRAPTFWSRIWTWLHRTGRICAKHLGFRVCSFHFPSIWEHLNLVSGGERKADAPACLLVFLAAPNHPENTKHPLSSLHFGLKKSSGWIRPLNVPGIVRTLHSSALQGWRRERRDGKWKPCCYLHVLMWKWLTVALSVPEGTRFQDVRHPVGWKRALFFSIIRGKGFGRKLQENSF